MDDASTPISVRPARPPLLDQSPARAKREPWLHIVMGILVTMLLLMVVALPTTRPDERDPEEPRHVRAVLDQLRRSIGQYRYEHGVWPAARCGDLEEPADCFARQLTQPTRAAGETATGSGPQLGPYLPGNVPANPINGLGSVRVLREGEPWPEAADGKSGWIYRASTGELRMNATGDSGESGVRYFEL